MYFRPHLVYLTVSLKYSIQRRDNYSRDLKLGAPAVFVSPCFDFKISDRSVCL